MVGENSTIRRCYGEVKHGKTWQQTHRSAPTPYYGHVSIQYSMVGSAEAPSERLWKRLRKSYPKARWLTLAVQGHLDRLDGLPKLTLGFGEHRLKQFEVTERLAQPRGHSFRHGHWPVAFRHSLAGVD
jgi:hypothetical protein